ncbi:MAG TPA: phosphodiester glycosidase family protein [Luteolibacter sp.]
MNRPFPLLVFLFTAATALAGETFRFDAEIGPDRRSATVHGYAFREQEETFRVIDLATQPSARLGDAFVAVAAFAGCNGGNLRADGQPFGLTIANSIKSGSLAADEPGGEGLLLVQNGGISLMTSKTATPEQLEHATEALQGGPFLVDKGVPVQGLDAEHFARRTILVTSGKGEWAILYSPSTTLDRLARMLGDGKTFPKFPIAAALNLAGGTASGIWFQRNDGAPPLYLREIRPGRNALAIIRK